MRSNTDFIPCMFRRSAVGRARRLFMFWMLALLGVHHTVWAGGGPCGYLVVYDPTDTNSVAVANYYQQVRHIPEANMVPYIFFGANQPYVRNLSLANTYQFITYLRQIVASRGMNGHFNGIAMAGLSPVAAAGNTNSAVLGSSISMAAGLFQSPNYNDSSYLQLGGMGNGAFREPQRQATTELRTDLTFANAYYNDVGVESYGYYSGGFTGNYCCVSYVGFTGAGGNSPQDVFDLLNRSKAADGNGVSGVIYCPYSGDDVRYNPRGGSWGPGAKSWSALGTAMAVWSTNGIAFAQPDIVSGPNSQQNYKGGITYVQNIAGETAAAANMYSEASPHNNAYLPGAWGDWLTSNAGNIDSMDQGQSMASLWIHAGGYGSSGCITEPYALAQKFAHPHIHTHFRNGASLAEAFWESMVWTMETIPLGDPLLQPYASFPIVSISSPASDGTTVSGSNVLISANASVGSINPYSTMPPSSLETNLDLAVDGHVVNIGVGGETIGVVRTNGGSAFILNTTTLPDGWHELRVIAYNKNSVRTQGETTRTVLVNNHGQSVALSGSASVDYAGGAASFTVTPVGIATATNLTLQANGRTLAMLVTNGGSVTVTNSLFGYQGTTTVYAVSWLSNGQQVWSAPWNVNVTWTPKAPQVVTLTSNATAVVKLFQSTSGGGFSWTNTPDAVIAFTNQLLFNTNTLAAVLPSNYAALPGYEVDTYYWAATTNLYEFSFFPNYNTPAYVTNVVLLLDGQPLGNTTPGNTVPVRLATGAHLLTTRFAVTSSNFNQIVYLRDVNENTFSMPPPYNFGCEGEWVMPTMASLFTATNGVYAPTITTGLNAGSQNSNLVSLAIAGVSSNGGSLTYTWSAVAGPEQNVMAFSANGTLGASNTVANFGLPGNYILQAAVNDGTAVTFQQVAVSVLPFGGSLTILSTTPLPNGMVNVAYGRSLSASGGSPAYTWSVTSGSLPAGLGLVPGSGAITGTPTTAMTTSFVVRVADTLGASLTTNLSLTIVPTTPLVITTTSPLPTGSVYVAYSQSFAATGGITPYTWALASGSLPAGMGIVAGSGAITGTPTTATTASFNVSVTDHVGTSTTNAFSLTINPPPPLVITTSNPLPTGTVNVAYNQSFAATGGISPYTWSLVSGSLPAGLGFVAGSGSITGTPSTATTASFNVSVTDNIGASTTNAFSLTINPPPPLVITTSSPLPTGTVNVAYNLSFAATGGISPYTWVLTSGGLPAGLGFVAGSSGSITGTPTTATTASFNVSVTDQVGTSTTNVFSLTIRSRTAYYWTNTVSASWAAPAAWNPNGIPGNTAGAVDDTFFTLTNANITSTVSINPVVAVGTFRNGTNAVTLSVNSGNTLIYNDHLSVGDLAGATGNVTLAGSGVLAVTNGGAGQVVLGQNGAGILTMNGGSLICDQLIATNNNATYNSQILNGAQATNSTVTILNGSSITLYTNAASTLTWVGKWNFLGGVNAVTSYNDSAQTAFVIAAPTSTTTVAGNGTILRVNPRLNNTWQTVFRNNGSLVVSNKALFFARPDGANINHYYSLYEMGGGAGNTPASLKIDNATMSLVDGLFECVPYYFPYTCIGNSIIVTNNGVLSIGGQFGANANMTWGSLNTLTINSISNHSLSISTGGIVTNSGVYMGLVRNSIISISSGGNMTSMGNPSYLGDAPNIAPLGTNYNNTITIAGSGSYWNSSAYDLWIGRGDGGVANTMTYNHSMIVSSGGTARFLDLYISTANNSGTVSTNNSVVVDGGYLYVTNTAASALVLGKSNAASGSLTVRNGGLVMAKNLFTGMGTGTGTVVVTSGGVLEANSISNNTQSGSYVTNTGGVYQFSTISPTLVPNGAGNIALNNGWIAFRAVTNVDVTLNWQSTALTFSGANTFRLNAATNTATANQTYVFDPGMGVTNYAGLELINGATRYRGQAGNTLTIGSSFGSGGQMLCSNTTAVVDLLFTNNGTLSLFNSTLTFATNAVINGTLQFDASHLLSLNATLQASNLTLGANSSLVVTGEGTNATLITYTTLSGGFNSITAPAGYGISVSNGRVRLLRTSGTACFLR